jgi:tetratricopeptide (TPR) repeat protein
MISIVLLFEIMYLSAKNKHVPAGKLTGYGFIMFIIMFFVIELNYLFADPGMIFSNIRSVAGSVTGGTKSCFMGSYSTTGFMLYYPVSLILKTPVPILLLVLYSVYLFIKQKKHKDIAPLLVFTGIVLFIGAAMYSKLNLGIRYILPVYPLAYIFIVSVNKESSLKKVVYPLAGLLIISNVLIHPYYQSYFNLLIGKNTGAYKYFVDSSLDWGQDLKYLAQYLKKEGNPELTLAYFGTADPKYYGVQYQNLVCDGLDQAEIEDADMHINSDNPAKEYLVVSATCRAGVDYPNHKWFEFLNNVPPIKVIGNTVFVYDITTDPGIYKQIAGIYLESNMINQFARCGRRISHLDKTSEFVKVAEAISLMTDKTGVDTAERTMRNFDYDKINGSPDKKLLQNSLVYYYGMLISLGRYDDAISHLNKLVRTDPGESSYKLYNLIGISYLRKNDVKTAGEYFKKCIDMKPDYFIGYYNLGLVYERMNDFASAQTMFNTALRYNPNYRPALEKIK